MFLWTNQSSHNLYFSYFHSYHHAGTQAGDFCYNLDGTRGNVDHYLKDTPINVECDPRLSCENSVDANCVKVPGMTDIKVKIAKYKCTREDPNVQYIYHEDVSSHKPM